METRAGVAIRVASRAILASRGTVVTKFLADSSKFKISSDNDGISSAEIREAGARWERLRGGIPRVMTRNG